jgi:DNA topoisomerase-3
MASRQFGTSELEELISKGRIGPLQDFREKTGQRFTATVKLTTALRLEFDFGQSKLDSLATS